MISDKGEPLQIPPENTGKEFAARRTIVKGIASALPVVMTIGCGKAVAQSSGGLACLAHLPDDRLPGVEECSATDDDKWVRRANSCNVPGNSLDGLDSSSGGLLSKGTPVNASSTASQLDTTSSYPRGLPSKGTPLHSDYGLSRPQAQDGFELLYVDANGCPVQNDNQGKPVTESCYMSFISMTNC